MKNKIVVSILLISSFLNADNISQQTLIPKQTETTNVVKSANKVDDSYEGTLKLLKEKEEIEEKNRQLEKRIGFLETNSLILQQKYDSLFESYNLIKTDSKTFDLKNDDLVNDEKKGRLPIPYTIYNINGETYAKVIKLNWYYTFKPDGTTMFNGYYLKDKIKIDDEILGYKVIEIENKSVKYCSVINSLDCEIIKILDKNLVDKLEKLYIVDGIPNQMLDKNQTPDILFSVLKKTNPMMRKLKEEQQNINDSLIIDTNLSNMINPVDQNGNKTGQQVPKNNIPQINTNSNQPITTQQINQQNQNNVKK